MSFGISNDLDTDILSAKVKKVNNEIEKAQEAITQLNNLVKTVSGDLEKAQQDITQLNESVTEVTNNLNNTDQVIDTVFNNVE